MNGLTDTGHWLIGHNIDGTPPFKGLPTGNAPTFCATLPRFTFPAITHDIPEVQRGYELMVHAIETCHLSPKLASIMAASSVSRENRKEMSRVINEAGKQVDEVVKAWQFEVAFVDQLGVTQESLEDFPYDVPELGDAWHDYLGAHSLFDIVSHARWQWNEDTLGAGNEAVRAWLAGLIQGENLDRLTIDNVRTLGRK